MNQTALVDSLKATHGLIKWVTDKLLSAKRSIHVTFNICQVELCKYQFLQCRQFLYNNNGNEIS